MNEAESPTINLDELRLLPAWLREEGPPPAQQYAGHPGQAEDRAGDRRGGGNRYPERGGDRRDARRPASGSSSNRAPGRPGGGAPARGKPAPRRDDRGAGPRRFDGPPAPAVERPAPVRVEFQPDDRCLASIVKQIRGTHLAYPLFGLARMFLQEPERHWLVLTLESEAAAAGRQLFQLGEEGPVTLDPQLLEKIAFDEQRERFYADQTEVKDPIKGNYSNVARERQSGTLLGPTNYHGYQPALRSLYESRFSRRMSFEDYRRNIEVVTDPAVVERWKEEARSVTSIVTREGEPPTVLATVAEARAHFREHHLSGLVRAGTVFRLHGSVGRRLPEPAMMAAIREAHERELRYPAQFVQLLRQGLQNAGLQIFKHRKRMVYVSLARPVAFVADGAVSASVLAILDAVAGTPLITRKALAAKVLGNSSDATPPAAEVPALPAAQKDVPASEPAGDGDQVTVSAGEPAAEAVAPKEDQFAKARAVLAADIRFLVQAGHIIEFHNGTFDLPLPPRAREDAEAGAPPAAEPVVSARPVAAPADAPAAKIEVSAEAEVTGELLASPVVEIEPMAEPETGPAQEAAPAAE
jgi:hypothetical protein